jgi:hypothetical protein
MKQQNEQWTFEMLMQSFRELRDQQEAISKQQAETDKQIKEISQEIGGISKSNGEMAEQTVYNALKRDMTFAGIKFDDLLPKAKRHSKKLNLEGQYDAVLINGKEVGLIEIKYKFRKEKVVELATTKLENFRKLYPEYANYEIILGIGGMSFDDEALEEAKERGIGIIRIIGDKVEYETEGIRKY